MATTPACTQVRSVRRKLGAAIIAVAFALTIPLSWSTPASADGLTPFDARAALYCDGTLQWSVTVGTVPGQRFTVAVDLVPQLSAAASTAKTYSGRLTVDPSKGHAVLFRRIVEAKVEEAISVDTGPCMATSPPPPLPADEIFVGTANSSVLEGNSGLRHMIFTVALSGPSASPVSVSYATRNNTANASDYVAKSGTVTIPAGATKASMSIAVKGDTAFERNERFKVRLSNPVGATLGAGTVRGKIFNDDRRA